MKHLSSHSFGSPTDILTAAIPLILKTLWLSAHWAGLARKHALKQIARDQDLRAEIMFLRDRVAELETALTLTRLHGRKPGVKPRYTAKERLLVLWYLEYFQVPRRHVNKHLGVARSTLYRWLRDIERTTQQGRESANKTPREIAALVWEIAKANPHWGRIRIAKQLALLKVFLAASTVRNILQRPHPPGQSTNVTRTSAPREETPERSIPAWYPNHVWSIDRTIVHRWGIWPIYLLIAIDHYSRRIVCVAPLEGANAGWTVEVLQRSFEESGAPKHIITDQEPAMSTFTKLRSAAFAELFGKHGVKHRLGAVGQHGSIAVTERAIKTLKYEWLLRVPVLKGHRHLQKLCVSFSEWYNH